MEWLLFVIGVALIASTWASLVSTFVLPRGHSFFQRPPALLHRLILKAFTAAARGIQNYVRRDRLLAAVGPIALLAQLVLFLAAFLLGFACALAPWAVSFGDASRQAAGALFIVGVAVPAPRRTNDVLLIVAAVSGAIAIALQIGYLPVIYQSYQRRESLVALMESRAGVPAWGPEVLIRHQLIASVDALKDFYRSWELWAADLAESHGTHPVLVLFRSPEPGYSWLLALLAVLDAAALQLALAPEQAPSEARFCLRMGFSALRRLVVAQGWRYDHDPLPEGPTQLTYDEFAAAVAQLESVGFPMERTAQEAWPHFVGWRVNYEDLAYRLADYINAAHVPWSGPRRHLREAVVLPDRPPHRAPGGRTIDAAKYRNAAPRRADD